MPKVDIEMVKVAAERTELEAVATLKLIDELEELARAAEKEKGEKEPAVKKQFVFLLSDPQGRFKGDTDFVGWVVQIPEDENPATALEKLQLGAHDFNRSARGRRYPVKTVAEACEFVSGRFFKEQKIWVKTKEPVLVVRTGREINAE